MVLCFTGTWRDDPYWLRYIQIDSPMSPRAGVSVTGASSAEAKGALMMVDLGPVKPVDIEIEYLSAHVGCGQYSI